MWVLINYKKYAFSHGQLTQAGGVSRKGGKGTKTTKPTSAKKAKKGQKFISPKIPRNIDILNQEEQSRNLSDTIGHSATLAPRAALGRQIQITQPHNQSLGHYGPLSLTLGWKGILFSDVFGLICCILVNMGD